MTGKTWVNNVKKLLSFSKNHFASSSFKNVVRRFLLALDCCRTITVKKKLEFTLNEMATIYFKHSLNASAFREVLPPNLLCLICFVTLATRRAQSVVINDVDDVSLFLLNYSVATSCWSAATWLSSHAKASGEIWQNKDATRHHYSDPCQRVKISKQSRLHAIFKRAVQKGRHDSHCLRRCRVNEVTEYSLTADGFFSTDAKS